MKDAIEAIVTNTSGSDSNTGSEKAWKVATQWLDQCDRLHSTCNRKSQPSWMPTRLLDVGTTGSKCLRLHVTDGNSPPLRYTTLSHCWGKIRIERLLETNFDSRVQGIDITTLPKTFQDAIDITHRLGIRYLWIDSLCIIQDSKDDWAKESSVMGSVYQNGFCNIAATAAPDGGTGCFMERDPNLARKCRIRINATLSKFRLKPDQYDLVPQKLWEDGLSSAPLLQRAWVVQERLLAPRVLHFGRNQLFWECSELVSTPIYLSGCCACQSLPVLPK